MGKRKIGKHNEFFDSITFTEEERKILYSPVDPNAINEKYQAALKDRKIMQDAEDFVEGLMLLMPEEYREDDGGEDSDKEGDEEKTARYLEKKYQPKGERKKDCEDQVEEVNFGAVEETGEQAATLPQNEDQDKPVEKESEEPPKYPPKFHLEPIPKEFHPENVDPLENDPTRICCKI